MSELEDRFVKRGYWVNLSHGKTMGQTITVGAKAGQIIVALMAVVTSLAMTHLWHLFTFFYYQTRATGRPGDGLFRHQQALLRTLPSPGSLVVDLLKLWIAWRGVSDRALVRSLIHLSTALLFAAVSVVASIFSSSMASTSNVEVLVHSPHCSLTNPQNLSNAYYLALRSAAESYSSECYRNTSLPTRCKVFTRPNIPFTVEMVSCPFADRMCATPAVAVDSGLWDLNEAFGLNLDHTDRIRFRTRSTCTVLPLEGFTEITNLTAGDRVERADFTSRDPFPGETTINFLYGNRWNMRNSTYLRYLFSHSLMSGDFSNTFGAMVSTKSNRSYGNPILIPELDIRNADTTLRLATSNGLVYLHPVNDPLFSAHNVKIEESAESTTILYLPDSPGSVLGCTEQYQICVSNDSCSELQGTIEEPRLISGETFPGANELQIEALKLLHEGMLISSPAAYLKYEAENLILLYGGTIDMVPDDQWIKEVQGWASSAWVGIQMHVLDHAIGWVMRDPAIGSALLPQWTSERAALPSADVERKLCNMQKMLKPGGFVNINFFGLVFTATLAGTIIVTDLALLRFLIYTRKYIAPIAPRIDRWFQDGIFQLQRRSHEAQGNGTWKRLSEEIPITTEKCLLPDLLPETLGKTEAPMSQIVSVKTSLEYEPTTGPYSPNVSEQTIPEHGNIATGLLVEQNEESSTLVITIPRQVDLRGCRLKIG